MDGGFRGSFARGRIALLLLVMLWVASPLPRVAAQGFDRLSAVNLVRLEGVLGVKNAPGNMLQSTLVIGKQDIPFSVLSAQRLAGDPMNGPGILLATGTDQPVIRLIGRTAMLERVLAAASGTRAVLVGNFNVGQSYMTLLLVELPESTGAEEDG